METIHFFICISSFKMCVITQKSPVRNDILNKWNYLKNMLTQSWYTYKIQSRNMFKFDKFIKKIEQYFLHIYNEKIFVRCWLEMPQPNHICDKEKHHKLEKYEWQAFGTKCSTHIRQITYHNLSRLLHHDNEIFHHTLSQVLYIDLHKQIPPLHNVYL